MAALNFCPDEDLATTLMVQKALAEKGVSPEVILQALQQLIDDKDMGAVADQIKEVMKVHAFFLVFCYINALCQISKH